MLVTANDVSSVMAEIWSAIFGLPIMPTPDAPFEGPVIVARVDLAGDVATRVLVRCDVALARETAATMFDLDEDSLEPADMHDTVGEIANIVAGNVKTMLGGECSLTIPEVTDGFDVDLDGQGRVVQDSHFACNGHRVAVTSTRLVG